MDAKILDIRYLIQELEHNIKHLERSQIELKEALIESPDDEDFIVAIKENEESISRRKMRISELLLELQQIDPNYDHFKEIESASNNNRTPNSNRVIGGISEHEGEEDNDDDEDEMNLQRFLRGTSNVIAFAETMTDESEQSAANTTTNTDNGADTSNGLFL